MINQLLRKPLKLRSDITLTAKATLERVAFFVVSEESRVSYLKPNKNYIATKRKGNGSEGNPAVINDVGKAGDERKALRHERENTDFSITTRCKDYLIEELQDERKDYLSRW